MPQHNTYYENTLYYINPFFSLVSRFFNHTHTTFLVFNLKNMKNEITLSSTKITNPKMQNWKNVHSRKSNKIAIITFMNNNIDVFTISPR